jgi:hypothetical protein
MVTAKNSRRDEHAPVPIQVAVDERVSPGLTGGRVAVEGAIEARVEGHHRRVADLAPPVQIVGLGQADLLVLQSVGPGC